MGLVNCISASKDFGPAVGSLCTGMFDLTLLFEETVLTILPICVGVLWAVFRLTKLRNAHTVVLRRSWLLFLKLVAYSTLFALQVALSAVWSGSFAPKTTATVATIVLTGFLMIPLIWTSYLEHTRSVRPSTVLITYLGISGMLDIARIRTAYLLEYNTTIQSILLTSFCLKILLFFFENYEKRALIIPNANLYPKETTAGVLNRTLFLWLNQLLFLGNRAWLTLNLLMPIDTEILSASQPSELMSKWENADKTSRYALLVVFVKHYKVELLSGVLPRLAFIGFSFVQPVLIEIFLDLINQPEESRSRNLGYGLVGAYFIVYIGIAISFSIFEHKTYRVLTMFRGSLISMIYGHILKMQASDIPEAEAITLMSADIDRIGQSMKLIHESYACVIELAIGLWLLFRYLGLAMAASTAFVIFCLILSTPIAIAAGKAQKPWLEAIETRLAVTVSAINSMRVIKMAGYITYVSQFIHTLRMLEIAASYRHRLLDAMVNVSIHISSQAAPIIGLTVYSLLIHENNGSYLDQSTAFAALSLFSLLDAPFASLLNIMEDFQTLTDCFERIQKHLLSEQSNHSNPVGPSYRARLQKIQDAARKTSSQSAPSHLTQPRIKSNFIASFEGLSVSYPDQKLPVLNNIELDIPKNKISMIIGPVGSGKSTLLKSLLGETMMVSGSITTNFATAAFCPQTPWFIDGTIRDNIIGLSDWDPEWFEAVVHACDLSKDLKDIPDGMDTQVLSHGSGLSGGQQTRIALARALYSREQVLVFDDVLKGLDHVTDTLLMHRIFSSSGLLKRFRNTTVWATNCHLIVILDEQGHIVAKGTYEQVSEHVGSLNVLVPEDEYDANKELSVDTGGWTRPSIDFIADMNNIDRTRKTGDLKVYWYYLKLAGYGTSILYLSLNVLFVAGIYVSPVWVQHWVNTNETSEPGPLAYWIGIYAGIAVISILASVSSDLIFKLIMVPRTSRKFHEVLLRTTTQSTNEFLTSTDTGTTTNRFSQDLELIDNDLPSSFDATMVHVLSSIAAAILVFVGSGYIAATLPLCIIILYFIQAYYLNTSRQLRLLDIEAKAPLFSHFLETLNGVASIRAYGWEQHYLERHTQILNTSQKPYYLMWCIQRWLALVLNLFTAGLATLLVAIATNVNQGSTAFIGVAMLNVVSFSMDLQSLVVEWTELETAVGAINRIHAYNKNVEQEDSGKSLIDLHENWPRSGKVVIDAITGFYKQDQEPILKDLSLTIRNREKIAICGRTGSGKSSLIAALLGMLPLRSGTITIDGIDICAISSVELRSKLVTIPQGTFVLPGTVRDNLDPAKHASDAEIISTLKGLDLWSLVQQKGGLDAQLDQIPFSEGQYQVFGLARAKFKPGKLLILDEINSILDPKTDDMVQQFLRKDLFDRTVISIVHKLHTVLDFDRIVVLEDGVIVEIGSPKALIQMPESRFRLMINEQSDGILSVN